MCIRDSSYEFLLLSQYYLLAVYIGHRPAAADDLFPLFFRSFYGHVRLYNYPLFQSLYRAAALGLGGVHYLLTFSLSFVYAVSYTHLTLPTTERV